MILKEVKIEVPDEGIATIAIITDLSEDRGYVRFDLYEGSLDTYKVNVDGEEFVSMQPFGLMAQNRYESPVTSFEITDSDYEVFYPPVYEPTEEELELIKLAEIAELEAQLAELKGV